MFTHDQGRQTDQHHGEQSAEHQFGALGILGAGSAEGGHAVGDRFDPGQRRATGGECLQQQDHAERFADVDRLGDTDDRGGLRTRQAEICGSMVHCEPCRRDRLAGPVGAGSRQIPGARAA
jgi:hypothetical protein